MGAWGTGLFSDDTAGDVRDSYREHLGNGLSGPEASARVLSEFKSSLVDPEQAGIIWLALAASQWNVGRLEQETLKQALEVIDSGSDLTRWSVHPNDRQKRQQVLEKLRDQLQSPQPPQKKVPKLHKETCDWEPGSLLAYRLLSGKLVVVRVVSLHKDKGGTSPNCELIDWVGTEIPSQDELFALPAMRSAETKGFPAHKFMLFRKKKQVDERIRLLDFMLLPEIIKGPVVAVQWEKLDSHLKKEFHLE